MKLARFTGWVVVATLVLTACVRHKDPVDRNQLLGELLTAVCTSVTSCCSAASLELNNNSCHDDVVNRMTLTISDPFLVYDADKAEACLDAMSASVERCQAIDYSPCYAAFAGSGAPGAACSQARDCVAGPYGPAECSGDGHCVQPTRGRPGEPCAYSCIEGPASMSCQTVYPQGAAPNQVACHSADGLTCVINAGVTCQPITGDCRQVAGYVCPGGASCDSNTGVCVPPTPLGGACTQPTCGTAAYCASGVCQPTKPLHGFCVEDVECQSKRCVEGLCSVFSPVAAQMCLDPKGRR